MVSNVEQALRRLDTSGIFRSAAISMRDAGRRKRNHSLTGANTQQDAGLKLIARV
jgi:hypothetical protein